MSFRFISHILKKNRARNTSTTVCRHWLMNCMIVVLQAVLGCGVGQCKPRGFCLLKGCFPKNVCPNGYQKDVHGCKTCNCKQATTLPPGCVETACSNSCRGGYEKDQSGCLTCACRKAWCKNG